MRRVSATEIEGMKLLGTFCYNPQKVFPVYFVLRVTKTPSSSGYWKKQRPMTGVEAEWTPDNGRYKLYTEYGRELAGDDGCTPISRSKSSTPANGIPLPTATASVPKSPSAPRTNVPILSSA